MKYIIIIFLLIGVISACQKSTKLEPEFYTCDIGFQDSSNKNHNHLKYSSLLNDITKNGVVGINMSVYNPQTGIWLGASGKADITNQTDMQPCHILRMGSTLKMLTATVVLKLQEEGKLNIDDRVSIYLKDDFMEKIENVNIATIRQLLQHSSGIYNYIQNLKFQTATLNSLLKEWKAKDLLQYAYGNKAYFQPDTDVKYSNTNYILLGLLIEKIEQKPLYQVFDEKIFIPLKLKNSLFASKNTVPKGIARGYIDIYSNLQVIESTYYSGWDYYTADGGLISTPYEMNVFFQALMKGEILNQNSLKAMLDFKIPKTDDSEFFPIAYGLGIFKIDTPKGTAYMHSGDAIGYYANMLYFPDDATTIIYAVNSNYGKIDEFVSTKQAIENILNVVRK